MNPVAIAKAVFRAEVASPQVRAAEQTLVAAVVAVAVAVVRSQFGV